jgi:hypothetical protein
MLAKTKMTMPTSKTLFYEFTTRKKIWGTFTKFCDKKNVLCEKGDEITRFDGTLKQCYTIKYTFLTFL